MSSNTSGKKTVASQFFRLLFLSGAIFIAAITILILAFGWYQRHNVLEHFSRHLQERVEVDLQFDALSFGIVRSFPMATVTATNVRVKAGEQSDPIYINASANEVQLHFNLIDILKKEYLVHRLVIRNGKIVTTFHPDDLKTPATDNSEPKNTSLQFDLRRLNLYDIEINYINPDARQHHDFYVSEMHLTGSLTKSFQGEIAKSRIFYRDHYFDVNGKFVGEGDDLFMNATVRGKNVQIGEVLNELPENLAANYNRFNPKGSISFEMLFSGNLSDGQLPLVIADFEIKQGSITHPKKDLTLTNISLTGQATNGDQRISASSSIALRKVRALTNSGKISGGVLINNLEQPALEIDLNTEISATEFLSWLGVDDIQATNGTVKADLYFTGKTNHEGQFSGKELLAADILGSLLFRDIGFRTNNSPLHYQSFNGLMQLTENRILIIDELTGLAGQSDISVSGTVYNLLPYLFINKETLHVDATLASKSLFLDELLIQDNQSSGGNYYLSFPEYLHLSLNAEIDKLSFRRFKAEKIHAQTTMVNQQLFTDRLYFNTMDGSVQMTGTINAGVDGEINLTTRAHLQDVDIHQLFHQTGNFGQSSITDENIYGRVTADIDFFSLWSPDLKINWDYLATSASLTIEDGRLVNYQPMQALGRFIRAGDLNDVAFSTLTNEIYISDQKVLIPAMEIQSNILNLDLSGEHGFGNEIDYRLRVELSELLAHRHRQERNPQDQYGEIIDDGLGRTTLFLKLGGTAQDVVVRYDQEALREKLREDFQDERENLREILRDEFRFLSRRRSDTTSVKDDQQKEMELIRKQEEEGFIIEWE